MEDIKRYAKVVSTWDRQWSAICEELKNYDTTTPKFEDILSKTESSFGSVLQTGIFDNLDMITTPLKEIRQLWRFVNESDIQKVTESRFIPQPEYVSLNRMNDKDRLYYRNLSRSNHFQTPAITLFSEWLEVGKCREM